jgi:endonuclease YncB( thermonuclease family)
MKPTFLIVLLLTLSVSALAQDPRLAKRVYVCEVVRVYDGDSLGCLIDRPSGADQYFNFRFGAFDAPERGTRQPGWEQAQKALAALLPKGTTVVVTVIGFDTKWRRNLISGFVQTPDTSLLTPVDVAAAQIEAGNAWFYRSYARSISKELATRYEQLEAVAHDKKAGIWANPKPIEPWRWRRGVR